MPTKQVTIQGIMTWEDTPTYPSQGPGFPTNPIAPGGPPPGVWNPVFPTNPIAPGGPPPGIWPSPGHPAHPIYLPPGVNVPGFPTHPIAPGGPPPGIWPGPGRPDQGLPGQPPGFWGGVAPPHPDQGLPGQPPGIWGGSPSYPSNPISGGGYIVGWSPYFGWVVFPVGGAPPSGGDQPRPDQGLPETPTPEPR
jgi:hypothetical protein